MPANNVGIVTARDALTIDMEREVLWLRVQDFAKIAPETARAKYDLGDDVQDWSVANAQRDVNLHLSSERLVPIYYRPLDTRWTYFTGTSRGFQCRPRAETMRHMIGHENLALCSPGQSKDGVGGIAVNTIAGHKAFGAYDINALFPLYLYPSEQDLDQTRRVNFDPKLYKRLQSLAKHPTHGTPDEVQVFDYIYGALHCPAYRATYAEFLKIDFPRIPWPATPDEFWDISSKGQTLRKLHLMDPATIGPAPYPCKGEGDAVVDKPRFEDGKVWIDPTQYFDAAPEVAWTFYIGGYQPAQKWLKDRKGRALTFDDVKHYQRILKILSETNRIMRTITMTLHTSAPVAV